MKAYHLAALLFMVMVSACGPDAAESGDSHNLLSTTWSSWPRTDGSTSQVSPNLRAGGSDSSSDPDSSVEKAGLCLTGDCTPITGSSLGISFSSLAYFAPSTNQCLLGDDSVVIKSTQSNRLTVFYRANYASVGRWQLYAQNIAVDAAGTMSLMGDKVNLHPNCTGNINGVTSFDVTEFEADQSTAGRRALDAKSLERAKSVKIAINCVNTARNVVRTIDLATLRDTTAATTRFLSKDGAVGYWPSKDLYIKGDGSTLTAAGQPGSVRIQANSAPLVYSGAPVSIYDYSTAEASIYSTAVGTVTKPRVKFALQHTRISELTVTLIAPDGQAATLMAGQSQSNPYNGDMIVTFPRPTPIAGTWRLRVYDCCRYDGGKINAFEIYDAGLASISSVLGEDQNGIYIRSGEAVSYASKNLEVTASNAPSTITGSFFDPAFGFMMTHQVSYLSLNVSTWDDNQNTVTTTDLYPTNYDRGTEEYGSSAECMLSSAGISRITETDIRSSCTPSSEANQWRSRFAPITRNNRSLIWRATSGNDTRSPNSSSNPAKSCRDSTQGFRCELVRLDLNNGVIAATKVDRQALDYNNVDRGFFGSHWMTERHDGNRGVIYLSNRYFE